MSTRKDILEMLSAGEIDVDRATEMLAHVHEAAPDAAAPDAAPAAEPVAPARAVLPDEKAKRRWLHIHVSDLETGRHRVKVNVPLGLIQFGMKIGARFTDEVDSTMMQDVMTALRDQELTGTLVEVEDLDDNERVHIFVD